MMVCRHCGADYEVPEGRVAREEHTCDREPPATSCVWLWLAEWEPSIIPRLITGREEVNGFCIAERLVDQTVDFKGQTYRCCQVLIQPADGSPSFWSLTHLDPRQLMEAFDA